MPLVWLDIWSMISTKRLIRFIEIPYALRIYLTSVIGKRLRIDLLFIYPTFSTKKKQIKVVVNANEQSIYTRGGTRGTWCKDKVTNNYADVLWMHQIGSDEVFNIQIYTVLMVQLMILFVYVFYI